MGCLKISIALYNNTIYTSYFMKLKTILSGILIELFGLACNKYDLPKGTPKCVKKRIKDACKSSCLLVYKYDYKGSEVYLFADNPSMYLQMPRNVEKFINIYNQEGFYNTPYNYVPFQRKWWHVIYRIPRKW